MRPRYASLYKVTGLSLRKRLSVMALMGVGPSIYIDDANGNSVQLKGPAYLLSNL